MTSRKVRWAPLALCAALVLTSGARAAPPPPPPPPGPGQVTPQMASCGDAKRMRMPQEVPATVTPISPESLGVRDGRLGKMNWQWSVRVASKDARVGEITSLDLDGDFGLIATTAAGDWLTFDLRNGTLDRITGVGVAPLRGAAGKPVSMAMVYGLALVSTEGRGVVDAYALSTCGMDAKAVPMFTVTGPSAPPVLVDGAYTYAGLVRQDADGLHDDIAITYGPATVTLRSQSLKAPAGYRLAALSNSAKIIPYLVALWRPDQPGGEALLQRVHVLAWGDVGGPGTPTDSWDLARLKQTPVAVASAYSDQPAGVYVYLVTDPSIPGAVDIHAFFFDDAST